MRRRFRRPRHGTVVAYLALFVALGGTALATTKPFTLGTSNTVDAASTVTSGTTSIASPLLTFTNNATATGASALALNVASGHAPFTTNSGTRVTNLNADKIDGIDSTGFVKTAKPATGVLVGEAWHEVTTFNGCYGQTQPPCPLGYSNVDPSKYNTAAYYKDPLGIVHLKGTITAKTTFPSGNCDGFSVFLLPAGYRPALEEIHQTNLQIDIRSDGWVTWCSSNGLAPGDNLVFDGITFRAAK